MLKTRLWLPALAGLSVLLARPGAAVTLQENFATDPAQRGWQAFGDTNLFQWDAAGQDLQVTWDSSQPNSYFALPLGTVLAKSDDFSLAFDLRLSDFAAGVNPQKPNPFQLAVAFINLAQATQPGFVRGTGADSPDLVEFSFFPDPGGDWIWGPSLTVSLVDYPGSAYADWSSGGFAGLSLTSNDLYHVEMVYTAADQTLRTTMSCNGQPFGPIPDATLGSGFQDFRVDHLAVCSYSDAGQDPSYAGSILAHGTVDNFVLTLPPAPVAVVSGGFNQQQWQASFASRTNWLYTLERSSDLQTWTAASLSLSGTGDTLVLQDTNAVAAKAFYRVRASRP